MNCSVGQLLTDHETHRQERTKTIQVATDSSVKKCYSYLNIILADSPRVFPVILFVRFRVLAFIAYTFIHYEDNK